MKQLMKMKWLLLLLFFLSFVYAKDKKIISGTVKDESGEPLPLVNIFISETMEGTTSNDSGYFTLVTFSKDTITLNATMIGFKSYKKKLVLSKLTVLKDVNIQLNAESIKLSEAVVQGSSFSSESGKGVVVSALDVITTPGGAADLYQSLKTMPGLTQVSESAELYVRGGDPSETVTMIDQASIYHPYTYESAYGGLFSNLNTNSVREMYFSSGGFSVKYGNVLSGVLDIQTKGLPEQTGFSVGVSMAAASLSGEIPMIKDKLGMRVYSQQSYTKPIMWLNGSLNEFVSTPTSGNITSIVEYKFSRAGRLKLTSIFASDKEGVKVNRAEYDGTFNGNTETKFLNLQLTELLGERTLIKSSLSYSTHNNYWILGILDLNQDDNSYKLRTDIEHDLNSDLKFSTGFEFEIRKQTFTGVIPEEDYDFRPGAGGKSLNEKIEENHIGVYAEVTKTNLFGLTKVFGIAGLRSDIFPGLNITNFDQRLGLGYELTDKSKVRFAVGTFHQVPEFRLFRKEDGNPDLKSMEATHYIVSYDYEINDNNSFRVEAYYKDYNNLPLENDLTNYDNNGYGYATGLDLIFKGELPLNLTGWLSYGFINTKRKWNDYENLTNSSFDITHNLSLILKYIFSATWQVGINLKYATGRPYTPVVGSVYHSSINIYEPVYGKTNSARYPDYKRLDIRLNHIDRIFGNLFGVFYMEGINILNIDNLFGYSYTPDYSEQQKIKSYFGRRTIVFGTIISY